MAGELWMSIKRYTAYISFRFRNGETEQIDFAQLELYMRASWLIASMHGYTRLLIVVETDIKESLPIADLSIHAQLTNLIFSGMRLAYVYRSSDSLKTENRVAYIRSYLMTIGYTGLRVFNDETEAVLWLISDDN